MSWTYNYYELGLFLRKSNYFEDKEERRKKQDGKKTSQEGRDMDVTWNLAEQPTEEGRSRTFGLNDG
jgi:hypothetical protein